MAIYEFAPGAEINSYIFPTNFGWLYTVTFRNSADYLGGNEILYNNSLIFEIIFTRSIHNAGILSKRADPSVKETIQAILYHHLEGQGHLPLYIFICYSSDKKEAARLQLFSSWFDTFETEDWQLYTYELTEEGTAVYYGLIMSVSHPFASVIPDEFERFVEGEKSVWKELFRRR